MAYLLIDVLQCLHSEEMQATRCMTNVRRIIYAVITSAVQRVCPDYIPPKSGAVRKSEEGMFGDYMCVSAMAISKVRFVTMAISKVRFVTMAISKVRFVTMAISKVRFVTMAISKVRFVTMAISKVRFVTMAVSNVRFV